MREQAEVDKYESRLGVDVDPRDPRGVKDSRDPRHLAYKLAMFAGCVPREFWFVSRSDVQHNKIQFDEYVLPYRKRLHTAAKHGYGLLFTGNNGVGKSMFISYLLGRAAAAGYSIYYTTLSDLDANMKAGFDDKARAVRLRQMLDSDFLAIDELAKEHTGRNNTGFLRSALENLLKHRYDDNDPTLLASNMDEPTLREHYGPTIASMLDGKFQHIELSGGDFRSKTKRAMRATMGFKG